MYQGYFLLYYDCEESFWLLCALTDIILPSDYYTQSLLDSRTECMLMKVLVFQRFPKLHAHFHVLGVDVGTISLKPLMTLHILALPLDVIARMVDVMVVEGTNIIVSIALYLFHYHEKQLLLITDVMELLTYINEMGREQTDAEAMFKAMFKDGKCEVGEEEEKRRGIERKVLEDGYMKELQRSQSVEESTTHTHVEHARHTDSSCSPVPVSHPIPFCVNLLFSLSFFLFVQINSSC